MRSLKLIIDSLYNTKARITSFALEDNNLIRIAFSDGRSLVIRDHGQICCEKRYVTTSDNLSQHIGGKLVAIEMADATAAIEGTESVHEMQFLRILTENGIATFETHNEHNGYYEGFSVQVALFEKENIPEL